MEIFHRRRFFFWLIRAYVKRWTKVFAIYFILGVGIFLILRQFFPNIVTYLQISPIRKVGIIGSYTTDSLPTSVQNYISMGLTATDASSQVKGVAAQTWDTENDGKTYVFHLRKDLLFQDGKKFQSSDINYQFKEAKITKLDAYTVRFDLTEPFSPFPSVVSRPIFKKGLIGLGQYKVQSIEKNGEFIESLILQNIKKTSDRIFFRFYPTEQAVKTAFLLGEVSEAQLFDPGEFEHFPNVSLEKKTDPTKLVAVFFNTKNTLLASKQLRQALAYSLPDDFFGQKEANSPFSFMSWAYKEQSEKFRHNVTNAKRLLGDSKSGPNTTKISLTLTTPQRFANVAQKMQDSWKEIDVDTNIQIADTIPSEFQMLLDLINLPPDPDQYNFWHSSQPLNITQYDNKRIDKLLEDGRKTIDREKRQQLYADFQKYLVDDAPAVFLYYPDTYILKRR